MSNLTLLSRFQRVGACNAAICIQIYDLLMTRRGTDRRQERRQQMERLGRERESRWSGRVTCGAGVTRNIRQRSIRQRGEKHQNRAINYIIVHRVSGAGHCHDGLPVKRVSGGAGSMKSKLGILSLTSNINTSTKCIRVSLLRLVVLGL